MWCHTLEIRVGHRELWLTGNSEHSVAIVGEKLFQQTQHTSNGKRRDASFPAVRNELTCTHAHTHNKTQVHELAYSSTGFLLCRPALSKKEFPFRAFHSEVSPMSWVLSHYPSAKHQGPSGHSIVHHNCLTKEQVCLCRSCSELWGTQATHEHSFCCWECAVTVLFAGPEDLASPCKLHAGD